MENDRSLVEHYRKRAEEIRSCAACIVCAEDRATLLQFADEYDAAAIAQEIRMQSDEALHRRGALVVTRDPSHSPLARQRELTGISVNSTV